MIVRRRSRRARMWNMGLLFLIYYCVSIYSAKGDPREGSALPLDVGSLAEDEGDAEANGEVNTELNPELETTTPFYVTTGRHRGYSPPAWGRPDLASQARQLHTAGHRTVPTATDEQMGAPARRPHLAYPGGRLHLLRPGHRVRRVLCGQPGPIVRRAKVVAGCGWCHVHGCRQLGPRAGHRGYRCVLCQGRHRHQRRHRFGSVQHYVRDIRLRLVLGHRLPAELVATGAGLFFLLRFHPGHADHHLQRRHLLLRVRGDAALLCGILRGPTLQHGAGALGPRPQLAVQAAQQGGAVGSGDLQECARELLHSGQRRTGAAAADEPVQGVQRCLERHRHTTPKRLSELQRPQCRLGPEFRLGRGESTETSSCQCKTYPTAGRRLGHGAVYPGTGPGEHGLQL
ncbi:uncharacterized protein LOC117590023 isoform X2 [Drosophila guanche]|uniref:uncharacterized protein LOC117590023 isoform X2 n=1 Tax=Drosophila guanche TaxID=7266 RepID=UPI0014720853|nr:uncharacterized protein LOC117590023 isoform X2 [Drosophila guanche]